MRNEKMVSHPKNTTVHKLLDARSYKGCIVTSSSLVLTAKGIGALTSLIERKHGVAELVDASRRKCKSHRVSAVPPIEQK